MQAFRIVSGGDVLLSGLYLLLPLSP